MRIRPGSALLLVLLIATACGPLLVARGDGSSGDDDIIIGDGDDDSAVGDDDDDAGDDDRAPDPNPVVTDIYPAPDASDFFYQSNLWVEFNVAAQAAVNLADSGGQALEGTTTESSSGRVVTFDPDDDLIPDTSYVMTVTWNSFDSPLSVSFSTGDYGEVLSDPDELVGRVYFLDLASATFVEPPGVGPILQSQMEDLELAFTLTADSDLKSGEAHVLGALMEQIGGGVNQDLCEETIAFTAGPDGVVGTADDQLGSFENPQLNFGPSTVTLSVQGLEVIYEEFSVTGTYHPDLSGTAGGTMAGTIDTRPLAPELDPEGGEEALCELVETMGVECEACASDGQPFCLSVAAVNLTSSFVEGMVLQERGCADIIADYVASGETCVDKATGYDEDADENGTMDGTYPLCPSWTPEPGRSSP